MSSDMNIRNKVSNALGLYKALEAATNTSMVHTKSTKTALEILKQIDPKRDIKQDEWLNKTDIKYLGAEKIKSHLSTLKNKADDNGKQYIEYALKIIGNSDAPQNNADSPISDPFKDNYYSSPLHHDIEEIHAEDWHANPVFAGDFGSPSKLSSNTKKNKTSDSQINATINQNDDPSESCSTLH